jgi:hypothetical protein
MSWLYTCPFCHEETPIRLLNLGPNAWGHTWVCPSCDTEVPDGQWRARGINEDDPRRVAKRG